MVSSAERAVLHARFATHAVACGAVLVSGHIAQRWPRNTGDRNHRGDRSRDRRQHDIRRGNRQEQSGTFCMPRSSGSLSDGAARATPVSQTTGGPWNPRASCPAENRAERDKDTLSHRRQRRVHHSRPRTSSVHHSCSSRCGMTGGRHPLLPVAVRAMTTTGTQMQIPWRP